MKKSLWLLVTGAFAASLAAQIATNPTTPSAASAPLTVVETPAPAPSAPPPPAVAAPKPAAKPAAKPAPKPKHIVKKQTAVKPARPINLVPGPAAVAGSNINVRAQATIASEVVTRLNRGEPVTVLEVVTLKRTREDEPAHWARIVFPTNSPVYIHTGFVNATDKVVTASALNLRAGPGENHSIVGRIHRGEVVSEIATKGVWMSIQPSTNASAFIAAEYLTQDGVAPTPPAPPVVPPEVAAVTPPPTVTTNTPIEPAPPAPPAAVEPPVTNAPPAPPVAPAPPVVATAPETTNAPPEAPAPPRIVQREGFVHPTVSIQAPSSYELVDVYHRRPMDFIYSDSPELILKRYEGKRVFITGEEGLDPRWPNMPVLLIQKIQVVE